MLRWENGWCPLRLSLFPGKAWSAVEREMTQGDSFTTAPKEKVCEPRASLEPAIVVWFLDELLSPALPQFLPYR